MLNSLLFLAEAVSKKKKIILLPLQISFGHSFLSSTSIFRMVFRLRVKSRDKCRKILTGVPEFIVELVNYASGVLQRIQNTPKFSRHAI